ncbi:MAG: glycine cleavage system aminomethyltransferase GcvT [Flavobacteriales bacterium]|jgi:aminomethyltransferase|uniref:glycine cleavage system aminomethyltransferase GcvT n=1 Tax=Blattabacterium sp. (Mastotermes darwiniensis) TaxID=39768 RepID=UPI000231DEA1|nr:glycine cleavage system aminomethyltransferase GcvT [Blattabacterium sp. (Mastotermes darwiniensis)]AER40725.1 aminomethyltransferase [Blattabacterium sp. (Mastotermes darwiniensis) str. MADAR]MDR1804747.1 glycine cleavage system aminomethyltransferase GcvT [Flavobacteriales bacterium]
MDHNILKKTTLYDNHIQLGAKMISYSGFSMPLQYISSLVEHMTVRKNVGIFDVSHMGKFILKGKTSNNFLQYLTTNNLSNIKSGQAQYTCFINNFGGIIDDLVIYKISEIEFLLIVNAVNIDKNKKWINHHIINNNVDLKFQDLSLKYSILSVQGPLSLDVLQPFTNISLSNIPFYHFEIGKFLGIDGVLISRTGYTGSEGMEVYIHNKYVESIWNEILKKGQSLNIKPCGIASRDSLRIEMGYRLYGQDISENVTPIEAGLHWIIKFNKQFIARNILQKQKRDGIYKKFISFVIEKKGKIPRKGYLLKDKKNYTVGTVTSGVFSPLLKKGIGLGFFTENIMDKNNLFISIRNKNIPIKIVKLPFIKKFISY